ncbi:MAG: hypothetical protein H8D78_15500 [Chloroflexi bacterium]|nr:hypothetical protein [Chloroflexota bacterium]
MASYASLATRLKMSKQELERESLRVYLQYRLREVQADIVNLCRKYGVRDAAEMEARYREGTLPEAGTWEDFFQLDHLEARRDELLSLLGES